MTDPTQKRRPHRKFVPEPFEYHQEIDFQIDTLTNMGVGLGRVDGWVVMVPSTLPGEKVRARIFRNHKNYSDGDLVEILEPSPDRRDPKCPLFGSCGGCQYQHLTYERQLEWKRRQVAELLEHMAKLENVDVQPVIGSPTEWNYRSKITPHFQKPRDGKIDAIGFLAHGSRNRIIDVEHCAIATETLNEGLTLGRKEVFGNPGKFKKGATLLLRDANGTLATNPNEPITEVVDGIRFDFLAGSFFQNNPFILPKFTRYVADQARESGAKFLVDAYCGSGLFCLTAAKHFEKVAGIEISESAIEWAQKNAAQNGITNCQLQAGSAEEIFTNLEFPAADTAVVIDPPRKGCDASFIEQLAAYAPRTIIYVSCNPATQIRDLQPLRDAGYQVTTVQPFDLFPQTKHLECVVTLQRAGSHD
ncbi:MAG: tRNA/tmRNA/rRNA uracil-C5-methylase (TrmA/RlmC/RlmD family) [Verrucomicrobiales bacterium]|jgi:tRNA/tmRNA/rRNA uracil-C5-methylase (TrmA/RlmC/RlmD family)